MDIKNINDVFKQVEEDRKKKFALSPQISLGELIKQLEVTIDDDKEGKTVCYDFGYLSPTYGMSWRGSYSEFAIGYGNDDKKLTDFVTELKSAIGTTFEGWKGGDFVMTKDTPVWVANSGDGGHTAVIGVHDAGFQTVILTQYNEY